MVLRAFLFLIGERKVPLFIRFIVEIPLLVTVYSNFTGATLWGTVLLWQANRRGAGGERKAPLLAVVRNSPLMGPDAPTPAREKGLQPYGALYCFEWLSEGVRGGTKGRRKAGCPWATRSAFGRLNFSN